MSKVLRPAPTPHGPSDVARQTAPWQFTPWAVAAVVAAITAVHVAVNGYAFGGCTDRVGALSPSSDHANILPWVHGYQDATLYPHDLAIQQGAAYKTILWRGVAFIASFVPAGSGPARPGSLEWTFFLFHLATVAATYLVLFLLARLLSSDDRAAVLACLLFVVARNSPAGVATHDPAFYTRGAAMPLALWSLLLVFSGRAWPGFAVLAAALMIHPLTAFYTAAYAVTAWLLTAHVTWRRRLGPLLIFTAAAAVIAWFMRGGMQIRLGPPSSLWLQLQRMNNNMHVFPATWGEAVWREFAAAALFLLPPLLRPRNSRERRCAPPTVIAALGLAGLGWVTVEWFPSMLFMQLQPFRGLKFTIILGLVFAATRLASAWHADGRLGRAAVAVAGLGLLADQTYAVAIGFALLAVSEPRGKPRWPLLLAPLALLVWFGVVDVRAAVGAASVDAGAGMSWAPLAWGGALVLVPLLLSLATRRSGRRISFAGVAVLAVAALAAGPLERDRDGAWQYRPNLDLPFIDRTNAWIDVQRWARANTSKDAYFLTPPDLEGFRTYSRRSHFGDWKQGTVSMFHEQFGVQWLGRMRLLVRRQLHPRAFVNLALNYDALGPEDLQPILARYGITHLVVRHRRPLPYRQVYDNGVFRVLETGPGRRG